MTLYKYFFKDIEVYHNLDDSPNKDNFFLHTHNKAELIYFISGSCIFHVEGSSYELSPGDVLAMRPFEYHYTELKENTPYERIVIYYNPDTLKSIDPEEKMFDYLFERKLGQKNLYDNKRKNDNIRLTLEHLFSKAKDQPLVIYSDLLSILIEINDRFQKNDHTVENSQTTFEYNIVRYINTHLQEDLSLDILCKKYFISKTHLNRIFKTATGTTVKNYINLKRLEKIKLCIDNGEKPTEAYTKYGFDDYSTFYRAFKKQFGISPKGKK